MKVNNALFHAKRPTDPQKLSVGVQEKRLPLRSRHCGQLVGGQRVSRRDIDSVAIRFHKKVGVWMPYGVNDIPSLVQQNRYPTSNFLSCLTYILCANS